MKEKMEEILKKSFEKNIKNIATGITFERASSERGYDWIYEAMKDYSDWVHSQSITNEENLEFICTMLAPEDNQESPAFPNHSDTDIFVAGGKAGIAFVMSNPNSFGLVTKKYFDSRINNDFLSPIEREREYQEKILKKLFPAYPDVCNWQVMNTLLFAALSENGLTKPYSSGEDIIEAKI